MTYSTLFRIATATFVLGLTGISPAFAHAALTGTSPEDGSKATDISEISLSANEDLLDLDGGKGFVIAVSDADGNFYGDGCVTVDGTTASMPVQLGESGKYTVAYRVVSADGHPIEGEWSFTYDAAPDAPIGGAFAETPVCGEAQQPINEPEPTPTFTPIPVTSEAEDANEFDIVPIICLATVPVIAGAIWLLMRSLGKRDSEDHLN